MLKKFSFRIFDLSILHYALCYSILYYLNRSSTCEFFLSILCLLLLFYFIWFKNNSELKSIFYLAIIQRKSCGMRLVSYKFLSSKLYRPAHND
jgi:hypothetical protein